MNQIQSQHPGAATRRDDNIDTLRGFACVLLVIFHVIGYNAQTGLELPDGHPLREFAYALTSIRMPLFTVLSGWVYAWRPLKSAPAIPGFMQGKLRRLMLPLFFVGGANAILMALMSDPSLRPDLLILPFKALVIPHSVYWFLNALFFVFIVVVVLEVLGAMNTFRGWAVVFLLALAAEAITPSLPRHFGIGGGVYLLAFFILGVGLNRFKNVLLSARLRPYIYIAALIMFAIDQYYLQTHGFLRTPEAHMIRCVTGVVCTTALLHLSPQWKPLAFIGASSYAIYLFHVFGVAGGRELAMKLLPAGGVPFAFAISLIVGLFAPLLVQAIAKRIPLLCTALLGLRFSSSPR